MDSQFEIPQLPHNPHEPGPRGAYWSSVRGALQPLFHATGLASYHQITAGAVAELEADLAAAAKEGVSVDVAAAMCNLALKVCVAIWCVQVGAGARLIWWVRGTG
jgi:cytochrome P450